MCDIVKKTTNPWKGAWIEMERHKGLITMKVSWTKGPNQTRISPCLSASKCWWVGKEAMKLWTKSVTLITNKTTKVALPCLGSGFHLMSLLILAVLAWGISTPPFLSQKSCMATHSFHISHFVSMYMQNHPCYVHSLFQP